MIRTQAMLRKRPSPIWVRHALHIFDNWLQKATIIANMSSRVSSKCPQNEESNLIEGWQRHFHFKYHKQYKWSGRNFSLSLHLFRRPVSSKSSYLLINSKGRTDTTFEQETRGRDQICNVVRSNRKIGPIRSVIQIKSWCNLHHLERTLLSERKLE
jgi:hypothetical protein